MASSIRVPIHQNHHRLIRPYSIYMDREESFPRQQVLPNSLKVLGLIQGQEPPSGSLSHLSLDAGNLDVSAVAFLCYRIYIVWVVGELFTGFEHIDSWSSCSLLVQLLFCRSVTYSFLVGMSFSLTCRKFDLFARSPAEPILRLFPFSNHRTTGNTTQLQKPPN